MPQLMPLYWILSFFMSILMLMMVLKIYNEYFFLMLSVDNKVIINMKNMWYW